MTENKEREPICGFCWAYRKIRHPLDFKPNKGWWECSICLARVVNPTEDEESLRRDLLASYDEDPYRHEKTIASMLRSRKGGGSNGRRRKKPLRKQKQYTLEEDARLIRKHNERVRKQNR